MTFDSACLNVTSFLWKRTMEVEKKVVNAQLKVHSVDLLQYLLELTM